MRAALSPAASRRREAGGSDPARFARRLGAVGVLREHHVWQAVKTFLPDDRSDAPAGPRRRFARLMEADALVDAVLLLMASVAPSRFVEAVTRDVGLWTCRVRVGPAAGAPVFSASHTDLAAAMLAAFLFTLAEDPDDPEAVDSRPHRAA